VFERFRKKKTREEMQAEIDSLIEEEKRLDFKIGYDKITKRVDEKRHSQSTIRKIGKGLRSAADTVFGGPPPQTNRENKPKRARKNKPKKKKKKDEDFFTPFF